MQLDMLISNLDVVKLHVGTLLFNAPLFVAISRVLFLFYCKGLRDNLILALKAIADLANIKQPCKQELEFGISVHDICVIC